MSLSYLEAAFGLAWIVFIVYILNLVWQRRHLTTEIKMLESLK